MINSPVRLRLFTKLRRNQGSAIVLALVLLAIIAVSIGTVLLSVRAMQRSSSDKLAYEETYMTALSGLAFAQAVMQEPAAYGAWVDNVRGGESSKVRALTVAASSISAEAQQYAFSTPSQRNVPESWTCSQINDRYTSYGLSTPGTRLSDGRYVLYEFPVANKGVMGMQNDRLSTTTKAIWDTSGQAPTSWVSRLRVTTPYPSQLSGETWTGSYRDGTAWNGEPDGIRRVSLIIEAEARSQGIGNEKIRVAQQKILVYPPFFNPFAFNYAIVSAQDIDVRGSSHFSVHWGPVIAKQNIDLINLSLTSSGSPPTWTLFADNGGKADKLWGAGISSDPLDWWVKYSSASTLTSTKGGKSIFAISGATITDFFGQVKNGDLASASGGTGPSNANLVLSGYAGYSGPPSGANQIDQVTSSAATSSVLYVQNSNGSPKVGFGGAMVQGNGGNNAIANQIRTAVDQIVTQALNSAFWKNYAIQNMILESKLSDNYAFYLKPNSTSIDFNNTTFQDSNGRTLYVNGSTGNLTTNASGGTALTLSMLNQAGAASAVAGDTRSRIRGNDPVKDLMIYIDVYGNNQSVTANIPSGSYFKGMLYVKGNINVAGAGSSPTIVGYNPDDFATFRDLSKAKPSGYNIPNCIMQGVIYADGSYINGGNNAVYGSLVANGGYDTSGSPSVWFDTALSEGLFNNSGNLNNVQVYDGPIQEIPDYVS